jgi:Golgi nucleoside diphosphatase
VLAVAAARRRVLAINILNSNTINILNSNTINILNSNTINILNSNTINILNLVVFLVILVMNG